jgi:hypothetical protein
MNAETSLGNRDMNGITVALRLRISNINNNDDVNNVNIQVSKGFK